MELSKIGQDDRHLYTLFPLFCDCYGRLGSHAQVIRRDGKIPPSCFVVRQRGELADQRLALFSGSRSMTQLSQMEPNRGL